MPRPLKKRFVCCMPGNNEFAPKRCPCAGTVQMTVDEYEAVRLIDLEQNTQAQCAQQMRVSRTTVQSIYDSARRKLAEALVQGKLLRIAGGDVVTCPRYGAQCGRGCRKRCGCPAGTEPTQQEETKMRIAVTYENGTIFQHFGHTEQFKVYEVQGGKVTGSAVVSAGGSGHGALAGFLCAQGVDTVVCGGIGGGAQQALAAAGIRLYGGVHGDADEAVQALLSGSLAYDPEVRCSHHDAAHGEEGHVCGEHGCGEHTCGGSGH